MLVYAIPKISVALSELRAKRLFVATPMFGGQCSGATNRAFLDLTQRCQGLGIHVAFFTLFNESLITRARNYLVDHFLRSDCTHLLFVDADIDFQPDDALALLASNKGIIGAPYPKKTIAWERIYDAVKLGLCDDNPASLEDYAGDYVFNLEPGCTSIRMDEPVKVLEAGTGFLCIAREVFERFQEAYPMQMFTPDHNRTSAFDGRRQICAFFDTVIDPTTKRYLSEDYRFCQWCRQIGIDVWLLPWPKLKHLGAYIFTGSLLKLAELSEYQVANGLRATAVGKDASLMPA